MLFGPVLMTSNSLPSGRMRAMLHLGQSTTTSLPGLWTLLLLKRPCAIQIQPPGARVN